MNTLVNLIASYLPPIRTDNERQNNNRDDRFYDLPTTTDDSMTLPGGFPPSESDQRSYLHSIRTDNERQNNNLDDGFYDPPTTTHDSMTLPAGSPPSEFDQRHDRTTSRPTDAKHQRSINALLVSQKDQPIMQAVHDLNTEILQLAAAVSDEFPLTRRSSGLWEESHCEFIRETIGDGMLPLLRDGDHEDDPTVVQLAIQAWEVWCCWGTLNVCAPGVVSDYNAGSHISGILAILALAGCTDERGMHVGPLWARFGERVLHITERTEALARILREGVNSARFEVVLVERPSVTPLARSGGRGQGIWTRSQVFDPATMENMYAGYGSEECGVLCTVAFGLSVVKRRKEGEARRYQQLAYLDVKGEQEAARSRADETTLLVKPKVLLKSVGELVGKPPPLTTTTLIISTG